MAGVEGAIRRDFLKVGAAGAAVAGISSFLPREVSAFFHNQKPRVLKSPNTGVTEDFWGIFEYNQDWVPKGYRYDSPGINLVYRHGEKLYAPSKVEIWDASHFDGPGKLVQMDAGIFLISYGHLDDMLINRGQIILRDFPVGTQGYTGTNSLGISHVAIRIAGNALIQNDINYETGLVKGQVRKDLQYKGANSDLSKHLVDPDRLTPNGKPLVQSQWDGKDYDTPYQDAVAQVKADIDRLVIDGGGNGVALALRTSKDKVWRDSHGVRRNILPNVLNTLWRQMDGYLKEGKAHASHQDTSKSWYLRPWEFTKDDGIDNVTRLAFAIAESTNTAARLFKMTSPYRV